MERDDAPELINVEAETASGVVEVMSVGAEGQTRNRMMRLMVDSRAGSPRADPRAPQYSASGRLPSRTRAPIICLAEVRLSIIGETHTIIRTLEGRRRKMDLQMTQVRKPLLSIGRVCDEELVRFFRVPEDMWGTSIPGIGATSAYLPTFAVWKSRPFQSRILSGRGTRRYTFAPRPCNSGGEEWASQEVAERGQAKAKYEVRRRTARERGRNRRTRSSWANLRRLCDTQVLHRLHHPSCSI